VENIKRRRKEQPMASVASISHDDAPGANLMQQNLHRCMPLADVADRWLERLAQSTGASKIAAMDGFTLLTERAVLAEFCVPGRVSAGGGCRMFEARDGSIVLNLARSDDRDMLPALFETEANKWDDAGIAGLVAHYDMARLIARAREMGFAAAAEQDVSPPAACIEVAQGVPSNMDGRLPRVLDLSALWAGPLAAHLLWLAGSDVTKIECRRRPDSMRKDDGLYALLNQGKASVTLDFRTDEGRRTLRRLVGVADIVVSAARPRALAQLGLDPAEMVSTVPGLVWVAITAHGTTRADWVGFGDDCGVAGGLSAALRAASGRSGFVGDAIADPLTGIRTAQVAWNGWKTGHGGYYGIAMSGVAAEALTEARATDPEALAASLKQWTHRTGKPFPKLRQRHPVAPVRESGADTARCLTALPRC
jgi:hypothetical protein